MYIRSLIVLLGLLAVMGCSYNTASFRGDDLNEREDGINVRVVKESDVLAVSSTKFHYSLILPYANKWRFNWEDGYLLSGTSSGAINVQISAKRTGESVMEHLKELRARLLIPDAVAGIESAEIISHRGTPVLVSVIDGSSALRDNPEYAGLKHYNIFVVRKWKDILYRLHLSTPIMEGEQGQGRREEFLDYATAGFSVSYMREFDAQDEGAELGTYWRRGGAKRK